MTDNEDLTLADEEIEMKSITGLLSIYIIYYNNKNNVTGHLFSDNKTRLMELINHVKKFKNTDSIISPDHNNTYKLTFDNKLFSSNLLLPLLIHLSNKNWKNVKWIIT